MVSPAYQLDLRYSPWRADVAPTVVMPCASEEVTNAADEGLRTQSTLLGLGYLVITNDALASGSHRVAVPAQCQ